MPAAMLVTMTMVMLVPATAPLITSFIARCLGRGLSSKYPQARKRSEPCPN